MDKLYHINYCYLREPLVFGNIKLYQIGRRYCAPSAVIQEHAHMDWYELTIVTDGEGWVATNGQSLEVRKGNIHVSFPGDFHEIKSSKQNPLKYDFFTFSSTDPEIDETMKTISIARSRPDLRLIEDSKIAQFVAFAIAEFGEENTYRTKMLELLLGEIVILLMRTCMVKDRKSFHISPIFKEELCYQIMHLIDTNLYSVSKLTFLSDALGYNYSYLSRTFKETTGTTISDYYQNRRLTAAKLLIEEGRIRFSKIAQMLNFSSQYAFSKAFKNHFGCSPQKHRESLMK